MRSFTSLFAALLIATIFVLSGGNASAHVVTCDFTTGGGWILIPSGTASGSLGLPESGEKANFGIVGGCKDRKSTRLNSSHGYISYPVFCLKKKTQRPRPCAPSPRSLHNRAAHRSHTQPNRPPPPHNCTPTWHR